VFFEALPSSFSLVTPHLARFLFFFLKTSTRRSRQKEGTKVLKEKSISHIQAARHGSTTIVAAAANYLEP
jgi:hypothetical protein